MTTTTRTEIEIADWLTERVAYYLETPAEGVDRSAQLSDLGFDSVYAMTLSGDIEEWLNIEIDATVAWDHPTVLALAGYLHERLTGG
ncbi:acyl carrier protein [Paractinoplanes rishiriensis]|uniref:Phosphopantetheine attachment site domain protein n=1 Tax=Paractinoplanes rishiriensis TaxID=1050105 RepID=A0A919KBP7_9ACTN|nr:acyl carrier protein [Actinoplanes rishiriensis]GIF02274.1 phosphopantetheine attachment site domain protein [Actinoplanes rishiriensis]